MLRVYRVREDVSPTWDWAWLFDWGDVDLVVSADGRRWDADDEVSDEPNEAIWELVYNDDA